MKVVSTPHSGDNIWYIGVEPSMALVDVEATYIANMRNQVEQSQTDLVVQLLDYVVEDTLNAFFIQPIKFVGLNKTAQKVVLTGVKAIRKSSTVVIRQVARKLSNEQMKPFAEYIDLMLHRPSKINGDHYYIAIAIPLSLKESLDASFSAGRQGDPQLVSRALQEGLIEIMYAINAGFFDRPSELLQLNFVMRQIARGTSEAIKKSTEWVIKNSFKGMTDQNILNVIDYMEGIIVAGPPHSEIC